MYKRQVGALHVRYKKVTVHIITSKPDDLSEKLMIYTHHGITRFEGHGCYSNQPRTLLYTVISTEELKEVIRFVHLVDDKAFINVMKTNSCLLYTSVFIINQIKPIF